jgi:hypothetical protein
VMAQISSNIDAPRLSRRSLLAWLGSGAAGLAFSGPARAQVAPQAATPLPSFTGPAANTYWNGVNPFVSYPQKLQGGRPRGGGAQPEAGGLDVEAGPGRHRRWAVLEDHHRARRPAGRGGTCPGATVEPSSRHPLARREVTPAIPVRKETCHGVRDPLS